MASITSPVLRLISLALAMGVSGLRAEQQVGFRSAIAADDYTSAGAPHRLDGSFVFELGAFGDGFTPTAANRGEWAAHWIAVGRAGYGAQFSFFTGSGILRSNAAPFGIGSKAYIWGFDLSGEWILMENAAHWTWPDANPAFPAPGGVTFALSSTQPGTAAIFGAVNGADFQMMTAATAGEIPGVQPELWRAQHFTNAERADPAVSGWGADPDGDGATNLEELAGGTDPHDSQSVRHPVLSFVNESGGLFAQLRLDRAGRALIGHVLALGDDLETWDMGGADVSVIQDSPQALLLRARNPVGFHGSEFYQFFLFEP